MRLFYLLKKIKYFPFLILLISISIFALPGYTKGVGEFFSSKAQVSWDDGGLNSIDKRAYMFIKNQESTLRYLPGNLETGNLPLDFGHPLLNNYGCRINSPASDYLINPGLDTTYAKGWYRLVQDARGLDNSNLHWGVATVSWGQENYERNCEYEYVYLPGSAIPTDNQAAAVEGDIYSQGEIVGQIDPAIPDNYYIAVAGNYLIESADDITGFGPGKVTQAGFYTLNSASTSEKNILNKFKTKLIGNSGSNTKGFIDEYYNVKYGKSPSNWFGNTTKEFSISTFDDPNNDLYISTNIAKNPDGDVYVINRSEGDLTIDNPVQLPENSRKLVYVEGNLYIKSNIDAPSSSTDPNSAVLAFVVEGDIIIDGGVKDVENIHAGLISLGTLPGSTGTIKFNPIDSNCPSSNPCRQLNVKGLVIGNFVEFNREPTKITFDENQRRAGVYIKYNPNIAKLPAFSQLLSAPAIDEASP